jgi:predicted lipid-binding transport protein (Tim44 family)
MIAGFIILRLRNILGRKTGHEGKTASIFDEKKFAEFKRELKPNPIIKDTLEEGEKEQFLKGAEIAYESILTSFAKGEKKELKKLLTKDMFMNFDQAIDNRNKENIKSELTFIGVKESKVEKFEKIKINLVATVKIVCEIISVKKDKEGNVIEGNPDIIKTVTDYWNFTKDASSDNPNWFLAEIISK